MKRPVKILNPATPPTIPLEKIKEAVMNAKARRIKPFDSEGLRGAAQEAKRDGSTMRAALAAGETPAAWNFTDEAIAAKFDSHVREQLPWYDALSRYIADLATSFIPRGGTVYDIGASTGNMTRLLEDALEAKNARAVSIEPSKEMAKRYTGAGDLWAIDAENIDYQVKRPDVAILMLVLMFLRTAEREMFLEKLFNSMTPGGAVLIVDKGYMENPVVQVACKAAQLAGKQRSGTPGDSYVTKELSLRGEQRPTHASRIMALAERCNLDGEEFFRFGEFFGLLLVKRYL